MTTEQAQSVIPIKAKRPRIEPRMLIPIESDPLEWKANKCTPNARQIDGAKETIIIDFWLDKHYYSRDTHGDDNGPRNGIEIDSVKDLVSRSLKHLLYYSCRLEKFKFINFDPLPPCNHRVVVKEQVAEGMLNVAIEVHFINIHRYEVTVKTAMVVDNFLIADGQYCIELQGDCSILYRMVSLKLVEVSSI